MRMKSKFAILSGIVQITNVVNGNKYKLWQADCGTHGGKRVRITRAAKSDLLRAVDDWIAARDASGGVSVHLTPEQASEAVLCYKALRAAKTPLRLLQIVEGYISSSRKQTPQKGLVDAFSEYYDSFAPLQVMQRKCVKTRVGNFIAAMERKEVKFVADIQASDVIGYLAELKGKDGGECSPKTYNMTMTDIRTFFNWCAKKVRRYCEENPIADLEKRPEPHKMPEFASVEDVERLFRAVDAMERGWKRDTLMFRLALSYFLGMRTEEIKRQAVEDVKLSEQTVLVRQPKGFQKGVSHRVIPINETAAAWLGRVDFAEVDMEQMTDGIFDRTFAAATNGVELKLPKNAGRHSFATYHVAAYADIGMTATILGNSPGIIKSNYQGLSTKVQGERYFAIRP